MKILIIALIIFNISHIWADDGHRALFQGWTPQDYEEFRKGFAGNHPIIDFFSNLINRKLDEIRSSHARKEMIRGFDNWIERMGGPTQASALDKHEFVKYTTLKNIIENNPQALVDIIEARNRGQSLHLNLSINGVSVRYSLHSDGTEYFVFPDNIQMSIDPSGNTQVGGQRLQGASIDRLSSIVKSEFEEKFEQIRREREAERVASDAAERERIELLAFQDLAPINTAKLSLGSKISQGLPPLGAQDVCNGVLQKSGFEIDMSGNPQGEWKKTSASQANIPSIPFSSSRNISTERLTFEVFKPIPTNRTRTINKNYYISREAGKVVAITEEDGTGKLRTWYFGWGKDSYRGDNACYPFSLEDSNTGEVLVDAGTCNALHNLLVDELHPAGVENALIDSPVSKNLSDLTYMDIRELRAGYGACAFDEQRHFNCQKLSTIGPKIEAFFKSTFNNRTPISSDILIDENYRYYRTLWEIWNGYSEQRSDRKCSEMCSHNKGLLFKVLSVEAQQCHLFDYRYFNLPYNRSMQSTERANRQSREGYRGTDGSSGVSGSAHKI